MKHIVALSIIAFTVIGCSSIENKTKHVVNKTGELAGETATEFIEGVSDGIDNVMQCEVELDERLTDNGISVGKHTIETKDGQDNQLSIYLIFNNGFKGTLSARAYDEQNIEIGRAMVEVNQIENEAEYYTFKFNNKTNLDAKSKIVIQ